MKFSKVLLLLASLSTFVFAEETDNDGTEEKQEDMLKPQVIHGKRSKEECDKGFNILKAYYENEVLTDPLCTYSEEYAKEHGYEGDYTMKLENRKYFCDNCLAKYLKLGNPMAKDCGDDAPQEMLLDLYYLSNVNTFICFKDTLHNKYCEEVMDELFAFEDNKPIINWKESTLCNQCPFYYHTLFNERVDFYNAVKNDSTEETFIGKLLPLHDVEPDCFKEFAYYKKREIKEKMEKRMEEEKKKKEEEEGNKIKEEVEKKEEEKKVEEKKVEEKEVEEKEEEDQKITVNDILNEMQESEEKRKKEKRERRARRRKAKRGKKGKKSEKKPEENVEKKEEKVEKKEEKKKASEAGEL